MNTILNQTLSLLKHEMIDYPVNIQYEPIVNPIKIKIDRFHIQQAILNLTRNAIEAMKDNIIKEPKILIEINKLNSNVLEVSVFDNGPGFSQEILAKVFEPHFTTKPYAIGLGLTVSRSIIEKHGGHLFALPNPAGGACVGFTLPCSVS